MEPTVKHLDYDLLRQLECPVCHKYMEAPITLCRNGHNICNTCKPRLNAACPTCRGNFLQVRNVALEILARTAVYPCKNKDSGCKVILPMDKKEAHQSECFFESWECPFHKFSHDICPWHGILSDIKEHFLNDHLIETDLRQESGAFSVTLIYILLKSNWYRTTVITHNELFLILWQIIEENLLCTVMHVGTRREDTAYKYRFTITTPSGMETISICYVAQSYLTDLENILKPENCVTLDYCTVAKFLDEKDTLVCEIEILKTDMNLVKLLRKLKDPAAKVPKLKFALYCAYVLK